MNISKCKFVLLPWLWRHYIYDEVVCIKTQIHNNNIIMECSLKSVNELQWEQHPPIIELFTHCENIVNTWDLNCYYRRNTIGLRFQASHTLIFNASHSLKGIIMRETIHSLPKPAGIPLWNRLVCSFDADQKLIAEWNTSFLINLNFICRKRIGSFFSNTSDDSLSHFCMHLKI